MSSTAAARRSKSRAVRDLEPPWTLAELASACTVSRPYLWKLVRSGSLAVHRKGRVVRVAAPEARRLARSLGAVSAEIERHTSHESHTESPVKLSVASRAIAPYGRK